MNSFTLYCYLFIAICIIMKAIVPSNGNTVVYVDSSESGKHKWWRIISLDPAFTDNRWGITTIAFYNETMNKATGKMMASSACFHDPEP